MTHNERVLDLLSDGEAHSHLELYALHVIAHSRISDLRKRGCVIESWREDDLYFYRLLDQGRDDNGTETVPAHSVSDAPLIEQDSGQLALEVAA